MPSGLSTRTLTSVFVVLVAGVLVYAPAPVFTVVLVGLAAIGLIEVYGLLSAKGPRLPVPLGLALVALLVLSAADTRRSLLDIGVFLTGAAPLVWAMYKGPRQDGLTLWAFSAAGALYVGWPLAHMELLRYLPDGREWLILAITVTWATDTGAYIAGSLFGRHKLAPAISPGKTVEGALGGLALTTLVGGLVGWVVGLDLSAFGLALVSLVLSVLGQVGDLAESYIKRVAGVKDSGRLLPGHGGLLDRIDGLLWVVVATYYLAAMVV